MLSTTDPPGRFLSDEQRLAAEHPADGPALLLVAGAGTGKTLTLASRVAWLVEQGADPQRLLLVTFSRRAAGELERRAGLLLHASHGSPAYLPPTRLPWCGTFHAVAARLLRENAARIGLAPGFSVIDRADAQDLLSLVRQALALGDGAQRFPLAPTCLAIHSRVVNTRAPLHEVLADHFPWCAAHEAALAQLFVDYGEAKRRQQTLDLDDLLLAWWHLMRDERSARHIAARFDHVLVDEMQDTNRLQADVLHALRPGGHGLTVVGDDAQAIYAFRGADVQNMLGFAQRCCPPPRMLTLQQNHRSTAPILAASNAVIALAAERLPKTLWSTRRAAAKPQLHAVLDEAAQARGVADAVLAQREEGLALKRQAVLFRTGHHSMALEFELLRRNIPFVKFGGLRFLEAAHMKDVLAVLRWADNPASTLSALRAARLVPGMGPAAVRRLLDHAGPLATFRPPAAAAEGWPLLNGLMAHLCSPCAAWPADLQAVIDWYQPHLERLHADARVRRADLDQLCRTAASQPSRERFLTDLTLDPPEAVSDEAGPPQRDEDYLILSTIHSAKGQEWNAVHVLNVVDGCMPADIAGGRGAASAIPAPAAAFTGRSKPGDRGSASAEIEEERRLLYVAMTRAKDALHLWVPQRFHVTQQRALGGRHLHASLSRFVPPALLGLFDVIAPPIGDGSHALGDTRDEGPPWLDIHALMREAPAESATPQRALAPPHPVPPPSPTSPRSPP